VKIKKVEIKRQNSGAFFLDSGDLATRRTVIHTHGKKSCDQDFINDRKLFVFISGGGEKI
jgi:hypothetical protein